MSISKLFRNLPNPDDPFARKTHLANLATLGGGEVIQNKIDPKKKSIGFSHSFNIVYPIADQNERMGGNITVLTDLGSERYGFQMMYLAKSGQSIRLWRFDNSPKHEYMLPGRIETPNKFCHLHLHTENDLLFPTKQPTIEEIFEEIHKTVNGQWSKELCPLIVQGEFLHTEDQRKAGDTFWLPKLKVIPTVQQTPIKPQPPHPNPQQDDVSNQSGSLLQTTIVDGIRSTTLDPEALRLMHPATMLALAANLPDSRPTSHTVLADTTDTPDTTEQQTP